LGPPKPETTDVWSCAQEKHIETDVIFYNSSIGALGKVDHWQSALQLLEEAFDAVDAQKNVPWPQRLCGHKKWNL
jgi:hypothetical protein